MVHLAALERAEVITDLGLVQSKLMSLSYEEYEALGAMLGHAERAVIWLIGDYLNLGEKLYGDDFYQAAEAIGLRPQTMTNRRSICSRIPLSRRMPGVDFSHHAEVAYLSPEEQQKWLKRAKEEGWSVRQLRDEIRGDGNDLPLSVEPEMCQCPTCGNLHQT
jgi:hypothetical protein